MNSGKTLYEANCGKCHALPAISSRNEEGWNKIVPPMAQKVIFILVVLVFIGYSCKKERDSGSILPKINNLFYYDFVPDIVATVPRNDTLSYYLDVNNDSIYDMKFFLFNTTTVVAHQEEVEYSIRVSKIDSLNFLLKDLYCNGPCQPSIDSGIYIKKTDMIEN